MSKTLNASRLVCCVTAGLLALVVLQPAHAEPIGRCVRAETPESIVLPDGKSRPAGTLRICLTQVYSPVSGLHRTSVNGQDVGIFLSRREASAAPESNGRPFFVFLRNGKNGLELESYTWIDGDKQVSYVVRPKTEVKTYWKTVKAEEPRQERVILMASYGR